MNPAQAQLYREIAFIAYHFHWPYQDILALEHAERRRWCEEISRINEQMNAPETPSGTSLEKLI